MRELSREEKGKRLLFHSMPLVAEKKLS